MDITLSNNYDDEQWQPDADQDFGTIHFGPGKDDSFRVAGYGDNVTVSVSLYAHEARQAIELLQMVADREEDGPTMLDVERLRDLAHREYEIAKLLGPSDGHEQAWLDYTAALVGLTDAYLALVKEDSP